MKAKAHGQKLSKRKQKPPPLLFICSFYRIGLVCIIISDLAAKLNWRRTIPLKRLIQSVRRPKDIGLVSLWARYLLSFAVSLTGWLPQSMVCKWGWRWPGFRKSSCCSLKWKEAVEQTNQINNKGLENLNGCWEEWVGEENETNGVLIVFCIYVIRLWIINRWASTVEPQPLSLNRWALTNRMGKS